MGYVNVTVSTIADSTAIVYHAGEQAVVPSNTARQPIPLGLGEVITIVNAIDPDAEIDPQLSEEERKKRETASSDFADAMAKHWQEQSKVAKEKEKERKQVRDAKAAEEAKAKQAKDAKDAKEAKDAKDAEDARAKAAASKR